VNNYSSWTHDNVNLFIKCSILKLLPSRDTETTTDLDLVGKGQTVDAIDLNVLVVGTVMHSKAGGL